MQIKSINWTIALLLLMLAGCAIGPQTTDTPADIITSPNDTRQYRALTLDNQLQVLLISDAELESAGASLAVGVGSYHNPQALPGLLHYLEHMLFLGTENYPEPNGFQKFVEQHAGFSNAYTATDHTNYYFQTSQGVLDKALDRFSDYFKAPTFDKTYSDKERHAVDSEWSMGRTQDNRIINRLRGITASSQHPAQQMSVGNLQTLVDQPGYPLYETMLDYFQRYYSANLMKLVVFGKQDLDTLQQLAHKHFADLANTNTPRPLVTQPGLTDETQGIHIYYQPQTPMRRMNIEFAVKDNSDKWPVKPNDYIANLISSEEPGTAAQILREKGWVDDFTAHVNSEYYGADGFFTVQIGLTPEGLEHQDEIIAVVFAYIELIRQQGVDPVYYHEYKAMLSKRFNDMQMPKHLHQAVHYSATLFDFPAENIINAPYVYSYFDEQAVRDVLQQLTPVRARIWHIHPDVEVDQDIPWYQGQYRTEPFSGKQLQRWKKTANDISLQLPSENDLFTTEKAELTTPEYLQPEPLINEPGLEVWLTHAQYHPSEQGYVQIQFNSGLMHQSASNWVMSDLLNRIYANATMAIRDKAGRAGIGMGIERPQDNHALTLSGYTEKHPLLYSRLLDQWFNLEMDTQALSIAKDGFSQWLDGQKKQEPYRQLFDELNKQLKHASWPDKQLQIALQAITLSDIEQYHRALLEYNRIRIFAFGNYSKQAVVEIADITRDTLADNWQPGERYRQSYTTPVAKASISHKDTLEHSDNSLLNAWYSPVAELEIGARLALLNAIFHNSFYTQLRTNEQIGYVVGSSYDRLDDYWGFIIYAQSPNTSIDALQARFDSYIVEYWPELQTLDDATLEQLRAAVLAQIMQPPGNFYDEYPRFLNDFYRGNDQFDTREKLIAAIAEVNKDDILALYRTLLLEGNALRVNVELKGSDQ